MTTTRLLTACLILILCDVLGCATRKSAGMRDLQIAWELMENGKMNKSMNLAKKYLYSSDAEEIFVVALLHHGRATHNKNPAQAQADEQCSIALLEKSAILGHLNASATLGPLFRYESLIQKDFMRADCWDGVVQRGDSPKNCVQEKDLSACEQSLGQINLRRGN